MRYEWYKKYVVGNYPSGVVHGGELDELPAAKRRAKEAAARERTRVRVSRRGLDTHHGTPVFRDLGYYTPQGVWVSMRTAGGRLWDGGQTEPDA